MFNNRLCLQTISDFCVLKFVVLVVALASFQCRTPIPERYVPFFSLSFSEQEESLSRFPIDEQIEIYIIGVTRIHPPLLGRARTIAKGGTRIIPHVLARLRVEKQEFLQRDLIYILYFLSFDHDLSHDTQLIDALKAIVDNMKDINWKSRAQSSLIEILSPRH